MTLTQLLQRVEEMATSTAQSIVAGNCKTLEDYRAACSRVRALQEVVQMATEPERRPSESTED